MRRNFLNGNSYLAMKASVSRNSPHGQFRNETIAKPLAVIIEMDKRTQEIVNRFKDSWDKTEIFYRDLLENYDGFGFVKPILEFISELKNSGESKNFRIGTSVHTLVISRSVAHGIRDDQKEIRIERANDLADGFEYDVIMRQGGKIYREYRVTDLNDSRVIKLVSTLKTTLID